MAYGASGREWGRCGVYLLIACWSKRAQILHELLERVGGLSHLLYSGDMYQTLSAM